MGDFWGVVKIFQIFFGVLEISQFFVGGGER